MRWKRNEKKIEKPWMKTKEVISIRNIHSFRVKKEVSRTVEALNKQWPSNQERGANPR